jgi:hypothetical protein
LGAFFRLPFAANVRWRTDAVMRQRYFEKVETKHFALSSPQCRRLILGRHCGGAEPLQLGDRHEKLLE